MSEKERFCFECSFWRGKKKRKTINKGFCLCMSIVTYQNNHCNEGLSIKWVRPRRLIK